LASAVTSLLKNFPWQEGAPAQHFDRDIAPLLKQPPMLRRTTVKGNPNIS
jgi:hypothetical protein